ncbi:MAG: sulfurtransferase TusA family protein [Rhodobiaceae bacterium]|nr:sulfurtransferase TusA family protein [Rhodobiaceae bacterium]MCC0016698.1 sulfurtransferase TusA family protein [Rhodobiaceae bacterium]MCC0054488.1 sulfurtransferase TusA family protein [Rhodobiaceae bacterium]
MAQELDVSGLLCPLPVLKARKALQSLKIGDVLKVIATDPAAAIDIPHFCNEAGHELVSSTKAGEQLVFEIRRGERARPA